MKTIQQQAAEYAKSYPENVRRIVEKAWLDGRTSKDSGTKETIGERKMKFAEKIAPYLNKYGRPMILEFFNYWTECNENGRKMRFEKEKTFEVSKRLDRWHRNNFNKNARYNQSGNENGTPSIFGLSTAVLQDEI